MSSQQRKQNRCSQHSQQIVALCIEQNCKQKIKAVCPLELYNDHLDHKFENITKIHSDWILYEKDSKQVQENISRESAIKYMDSIIDELMLKIKEHLFLLRKQFEIKLGVYYNSKPVQKIKIAMIGINKCLSQRFLELQHQQIANAKFFIEVYGMKKLMNDTLTQRENFEKQILVGFAKIKEEMFMDYPKFNALVKAKEYEYCQIIKAQKIEIEVLRDKVSEMSGGYDKMKEEHKLMSYELGRATNELKNKEKNINDLTDKLNLMSKKYQQQAQQAIMKARQIKTQNVFGLQFSKNLHRVNERVVRTGHRQFDWPNFIDIGEGNGKVFIRVNRFDVGSWILVGVMFKKEIEGNEYQFDNYKEIGHGAYLLDSNRWSYSDNDQSYNCKPLGFEFGQNDIIRVEVLEDVIKFSKMAYGWQEQKFELPYKNRQNDDILFCVAIRGEHTQVQLV